MSSRAIVWLATYSLYQPIDMSHIRICDGTARHIDCHFQGGGRLVKDLPPKEALSYGVPTLAFTDGREVHIVVNFCEIICRPVPAP